jgi:hypothetical protein
VCADAHEFSLHAGVRCDAHQRKELERLCRYITRPAIANERQLWRKSTVSNGSIAEIRHTGKRPIVDTKPDTRCEMKFRCGVERAR